MDFDEQPTLIICAKLQKTCGVLSPFSHVVPSVNCELKQKDLSDKATTRMSTLSVPSDKRLRVHGIQSFAVLEISVFPSLLNQLKLLQAIQTKIIRVNQTP